ncbi:DUF6207 family protein [Streptomyces phaeochromogenes]|nr:DUF6207 family protein [Streptomyces phaeochromogenes]
MGPINETHVAEPGLAVVEVIAADDDTALAVQELLATRWATATMDRTARESGVRLRCYLHVLPARRPAAHPGLSHPAGSRLRSVLRGDTGGGLLRPPVRVR